MQELLSRALQQIDSATEGMSEEQLMFHPDGKWSSAQILEHLYLTYTGTIKGMNRALEAGKGTADSPSFKQRLQHLVVLEMGFFPPGRKSPLVVEPKGTFGGKESVEKIRQALLEMDAKLTECGDKISKSASIANHPVLGPLRLDQWCKFHLVHATHHMKQIRRLQEMQR